MLPVLDSERLRLRPAVDADVDFLHALLTDPEVRRYLCDGNVFPRDLVAAMFEDSKAQAARGLGWWVIETAGEAIGLIALLPVSDTVLPHVPGLAGEIEPTVALLPAYWGQGLANEALGAVHRHAFETLGLSQLVAMTDEPNTQSQAMLTGAGYVKTGESTGPAWPTWVYRLQRP